jgi:NADH dehydrogenase
MKVFLTGATGFVGSHMLERLLADGHHVRALVREPQKLSGWTRATGELEPVRGDIVSGDGLEEGLRGADAVIHLVGIIMEVGVATFERVHYQGSKNVVDAAKRAGVKRMVHMSALGARADGVSGYQTTKWRAEEEVRGSGISHVILRPSIIFGPRDGFVSQMVDVMRKAPLVRPVPGHGGYRFRPVWIGNVVDCFVQSLTNEKAVNRTIEVVGPDELTLGELLGAVAECVGVKKPAVKVPLPIMKFNAALMGLVLPRPPVTLDQLRMLEEGSTADPGPMLATFNLAPVGFREGLSKYLCQ